MSFSVIILIFITIIFNTIAQLALKIGMGKIGFFTFNLANLVPITLKIFFSPWIILGIVIYVGSVATWLMVLSRTPVSIAYPLSSLGYITSAILAYYLLGENISLIRIMGIFVILVGVYMVSRN